MFEQLEPELLYRSILGSGVVACKAQRKVQQSWHYLDLALLLAQIIKSLLRAARPTRAVFYMSLLFPSLRLPTQSSQITEVDREDWTIRIQASLC